VAGGTLPSSMWITVAGSLMFVFAAESIALLARTP